MSNQSRHWRTFQKHPVIKRRDLYAQHYVCFSCRKMFNKHFPDEIVEPGSSPQDFWEKHRPPCPECSKPMLNMGNGFKPPKRSDIKRWSFLEKQANAGKRFRYCPSWL
jgi:hypothetical protein